MSSTVPMRMTAFAGPDIGFPSEVIASMAVKMTYKQSGMVTLNFLSETLLKLSSDGPGGPAPRTPQYGTRGAQPPWAP